MADEADIASHMRRIDERTEHMAEDLHDLKVRMSSVEVNPAAVNRRMDRLLRSWPSPPQAR